MESKHVLLLNLLHARKLLIEPVWNRNGKLDGWRKPCSSTFNRTSMESKLSKASSQGASKRLLIEPVWNRNRFLGSACEPSTVCLLIEPVWNRNNRDAAQKTCEVNALLIEPVWNRNQTVPFAIEHLLHTFNRTSMESKPESPTSFNNFPVLLIEPVWNRNCVIGDLWHRLSRF